MFNFTTRYDEKRSYVEKKYRGLLYAEKSIEEVDTRDPMKVENDGYMQGFRFYDQVFIIDGKKVYEGEPSNYSKWIYFGKRLSIEEVKDMYGDNPEYRTLIWNIELNDYEYVCHTQADSFVPMEEGDMTFDEYVAQKEALEKSRKEREENQAKKDMEAKKAKYALMKEGVNLVKPETIKDWVIFADNNTNDSYSIFVVKAAVSMMKKFEEGISFDDAEKQVYTEELGLSDQMAVAATDVLAHFAKNGEEYRNHFNKKYGVEDPIEKIKNMEFNLLQKQGQ